MTILKRDMKQNFLNERSNKISNITNYIPHLYVLGLNKPGKIRVVFDAAAKHNNISLNET